MSLRVRRLIPAVVLTAACSAGAGVISMLAQGASPTPPSFAVDPKWPTVPNNWVLGEVTSIAVDSEDQSRRTGRRLPRK
jgi:hypothetical protein